MAYFYVEKRIGKKKDRHQHQHIPGGAYLSPNNNNAVQLQYQAFY